MDLVRDGRLPARGDGAAHRAGPVRYGCMGSVVHVASLQSWTGSESRGGGVCPVRPGGCRTRQPLLPSTASGIRIQACIRTGICSVTDLHVADDIVPIGEFKTQAARLLRRVAQTSRPLVITQNGRPAGVMLSPAEYDRLCARERFLVSVAAGAVDAEEGRVMDSDTLRTRLAERRRERDTS